MATKAELIDIDRGWLKTKRAFTKKDRNARVRVGIQGDGKIRGLGAGIDMVALASVHEFGSLDGRIPQRSFIRSTFDQNKGHYQKLINKLAEKVFDDKMTAEQALGLIAQKFIADIKAKILAGIDPPLAEMTIERRTKKIRNLADNKNQTKAAKAIAHLDKHGELPSGSITPLVDTGRMINSIRAVYDR